MKKELRRSSRNKKPAASPSHTPQNQTLNNSLPLNLTSLVQQQLPNQLRKKRKIIMKPNQDRLPNTNPCPVQGPSGSSFISGLNESEPASTLGSSASKSKSTRQTRNSQKAAAPLLEEPSSNQIESENDFDDDQDEDDNDQDHLDFEFNSGPVQHGSGSPMSSSNNPIIQALTSDQPYVVLIALQDLSEVLVVATEESFLIPNNPLSPSRLFPLLINLLDSPLPDTILLSLRCIFNLLDLTSPSLLNSGGIAKVVSLLGAVESIEVVEAAIRVLERVATELPVAVLKSGAMAGVMRYFDFFGSWSQKSAVGVCLGCCRGLLRVGNNEAVASSVEEVLAPFTLLLSYSDERIIENIASCISLVAEFAAKSNNLVRFFKRPYLEAIVAGLNVHARSGNVIFLSLLKSLTCIASHRKLADELIVDINLLQEIHCIVLDAPNSTEATKAGTQVISFCAKKNDFIFAVLELMGALMPKVQAVGFWRVGPAPSTTANDSKAVICVKALDLYIKYALPLLFSVFMTSSVISCRTLTVRAILNLVATLPDDRLAPTLEAIPHFGKFMYELVHYHKAAALQGNREEKILLFSGLALANHLMQVAGDDSGFGELFGREGVTREVRLLVNSANGSNDQHASSSTNQKEQENTGNDDKIVAFFQTMIQAASGTSSSENQANLATRISQIKNAMMPSSSTSSFFMGFTDERIALEALEAKINELAKDFTQKMVPFAKNEEMGEDVKAVLEIIRNSGSSGDIEGVRIGLSKLADMIGGTIADTSAVTTHFALFSGDLVVNLIDYLSGHSKGKAENSLLWNVDLKERIFLFMDVFFKLNTKEESPFLILISHLQEHLARLDHLQLLSISSNQDSSSPFARLGIQKQLRLQLVPLDPFAGTTGPINVYIPAAANFAVIENFIQTKVMSKMVTGSNEIPTISNTDDDDSDQDDEDEQEIDGTEVPFAESAATEMEIVLERTASEASSNVSGEKVSSPHTVKAKPTSTLPAEPSTSKATGQYVRFLIDDQEVDSDSTVFGALYRADTEKNFSSIFRTNHAIKFRIVSKRPARNIGSEMYRKKMFLDCTCNACQTFYADFASDSGEYFNSIDLKNTLHLVGLLNSLNYRYSMNRTVKTDAPYFVSPAVFLNTKLTSKISRQLAEPLLSVSVIHPDWLWSLVYNYSCLLPFEERTKFLKLTALGSVRNMTNWIQYHRQPSSSASSSAPTPPQIAPRRERLKVRISRELLFESLIKIIATEGVNRSMLEVEFYNEVGSGLGPTMEFFSLTSKAIRFSRGLRATNSEQRQIIWRNEDGNPNDMDQFLNPLHGLYPRPISYMNSTSISTIFSIIGSFVAKAFLDSRQLDIQFSPLFIEQVFHGSRPLKKDGMSLLKIVSPQLHSSLKKIENATSGLEDMMLDFTLPGYPEYELLPNGSNITVSPENISQYVNLVVDATVETGVSNQIKSFQKGFDKIIPLAAFDCFTVDEILILIGGERHEDWSLQVLTDSIKADHGYNIGSRLVQQFLELLSNLSEENKRLFLSFCTGSPRLPIGGFSAFTPPLTIVRKTVEKSQSVDDCLPSVMTCAHYLKVPEYSSPEVMLKQFLYAIKEGQTTPFADNPSQGLIPLSISNLCVSRMQGWVIIVNHLIKYLTSFVDQEKIFSENLSRTASEFSGALDSESMAVFSKDETVRGLLMDITEMQGERSKLRQQTGLNIQEQLLPILKELLMEIKKKVADTTKWGALDRDLKNDLETYCRLAANLRASLMRQQWMGNDNDFPDIPKDCPKDPWIANIGLRNHIVSCYKKQEEYRNQIVAQENDFAAFEAVIVQNIKLSLATFYEWMSGTFNLHMDQIKFLQSSSGKLEPQYDWNVFRLSNDNRFLVSKVDLVQVHAVQYDGFDDPGIKIMKQGRLLRKEGVFKRSYKPMTLVLTASSYLHVFPELEKSQPIETAVPELTIDLTECTLIPLMMNEQDPEEIALMGKPGMWGNTKHKFRGDTMEVSVDWWGKLNEQMRRYGGSRNMATKVADESDLKSPSQKSPVHKSPTTASPTQALPISKSPPVKAEPEVKKVEDPIPLPPRPNTKKRPENPIPEGPSIAAPPTENIIPQFAQFPQYEPAPPPESTMAHLSLTEQMELRLQARISPKAAPELEVPQFEASQPRQVIEKKANPWDTMEADEGGW